MDNIDKLKNPKRTTPLETSDVKNKNESPITMSGSKRLSMNVSEQKQKNYK